MSFSENLIDLFKEKKGLETDKDAGEAIPKMGKQNLYAVRKGKIHLTEEQALWIAEQCALDAAQVLVELAAEKSKTDTAKAVWSSLAKKLKAAASAAIVAAILMVSAVSAVNPPLRLKRISHNVYYVKSDCAGVTASLWLGVLARFNVSTKAANTPANLLQFLTSTRNYSASNT